MESNYLNIKKASEYLNIAKSTLYTYVSKQKIPYIKLGDRVLFETRDLDSWLGTKKVSVSH
jgi:excisionase family DNA binding protein